MKKLLIWQRWAAQALLLLSFSQTCIASGITVTLPVCGNAGTVVGFTNGIQSTLRDAKKNLRALERLTPDGTKASAAYNFYHQKGRTGQEGTVQSFKLDVLEVFWQMAQEAVGNDPAREAQAMALFFHAVAVPAATDPVPSLVPGLVEWLAQAETDAEARAFLAAASMNVALETQQDVSQLQSILAGGANLLMAAHSQGTLWANAALQTLTAQSPALATRVRLTSAGMAADHVWQTPGSTRSNTYVTSTNDIVINALRATAQDKGLPLPAPAYNTHAAIDLKGHGFAEIYLDQGSDAGAAFLREFVAGYPQQNLEEQASTVIYTADLTYTTNAAGQAFLDSFQATGIFPWSRNNNHVFEDPKLIQGFGNDWSEARVGPQAIRQIVHVYCPLTADQRTPYPPFAYELFLQNQFSFSPTAVVSIETVSIAGTITFGGVAYPVDKLKAAPVVMAGNTTLMVNQLAARVTTDGVTGMATLTID